MLNLIALLRWVGYSLPIIGALLGRVSFSLVACSGAYAGELAVWISQSRLPTVVQQAFNARIAVAPQAGNWLVEQDQQVYALVYQPQRATAQAQIAQARRSIAEQRARNLLLVYAVGEHYQRLGFSNREAITKALTRLEAMAQGRLLSGLQSQAAVLNNGGVALVWIGEERIRSFRQHPPAVQEFRPAYCQALYPTAQALFLEHKHRAALVVYQEMQGLQCSQPTVYFIDAAECFLALKQFDDAKRLANYVLAAQAELLNSAAMERVGDVLLQTGDEAAAQKAYELALLRLKTRN